MGAGWRSEVQEIPKQRSFVLVYLALCLCVFLGVSASGCIMASLRADLAFHHEPGFRSDYSGSRASHNR